MKRYLHIALAALILASCKKEVRSPALKGPFPEKIKTALKAGLSENDFSRLDYAGAVATRIESQNQVLLRVPFFTKANSQEFVLLETDENWNVSKGKIVEMSGSVVRDVESKVSPSFQGEVTIHSMDRASAVHSSIENGYIISFHEKLSQLSLAAPIYPDPYVELPEVIVVASYSSGDITWSTWVSLMSLLGNSTGNYYGSIDAGSGGSGAGAGDSGGSYWGGGSGGGGGSVWTEPAMTIDYETVEDKTPIDVSKFINCFSALSDAGAECSIELFTDIPVDSDPNKIFDWDNQSPGHAFIQIKKSNGPKVVMQNVGFYPQKNWKTVLTPAPVGGKFVDNGTHEFNASIKMNVSPENFQTILTHILYLARFVKYDIDEYNCTDWALDIFNAVRTSKIKIPKFDIPGGETPNGTNTPQGLFLKLKQMKEGNYPEAANITIGIVKGWVAKSNGPCN